MGGGVVTIETFRRKEHKYLITTEQYVELVQRMSSYMRPDRHGINGKYTVTTLYFESLDHKIYGRQKTNYSFDKSFVYACMIRQILSEMPFSKSNKSMKRL